MTSQTPDSQDQPMADAPADETNSQDPPLEPEEQRLRVVSAYLIAVRDHVPQLSIISSFNRQPQQQYHFNSIMKTTLWEMH